MIFGLFEGHIQMAIHFVRTSHARLSSKSQRLPFLGRGTLKTYHARASQLAGAGVRRSEERGGAGKQGGARADQSESQVGARVCGGVGSAEAGGCEELAAASVIGWEVEVAGVQARGGTRRCDVALRAAA